jgi:hypothetical protein
LANGNHPEGASAKAENTRFRFQWVVLYFGGCDNQRAICWRAVTNGSRNNSGVRNEKRLGGTRLKSL